jgi:hypothetical protein
MRALVPAPRVSIRRNTSCDSAFPRREAGVGTTRSSRHSLAAAAFPSPPLEGQGEEAAYLSHHAGCIETASRWKVAVNCSTENREGEGVLGLSSQRFDLSASSARCP